MKRVQDKDTLEAFCRLLSQAFAVPVASWEIWVSRIGQSHLRYLEEGGSIVCGLGFYPFAHFWQGKAVPSAGIAGVGTTPHRRGCGYVKQLLLDVLRECKADGLATASLYPAEWPIYRSCGFELAGSHHHFRAEVTAFTQARAPRSLDLEPVSPLGDMSIRQQYRHRAQESHGWLDRNEAIWNRVATSYQNDIISENFCYRIGADGGYFIYSQNIVNGHQELTIHDYVLNSPEAVQQLLMFLAYHSSMFKRVRWKGCPQGGFFQQNQSRHYDVEKVEAWMLRILDIEKAFSQRGYSTFVSADILLKIQDAHLPENSGIYQLQVCEGVGAMTKVENSTNKNVAATDIQTLSALYTGYLSPNEARRQRRLICSDRECEILIAAFSGHSPWCPDYF